MGSAQKYLDNGKSIYYFTKVKKIKVDSASFRDNFEFQV